MDSKSLRILLGLRNATLSALRAKKHDLAEHVTAFVRRSEIAVFHHAIADLPEHVRLKVAEIDLTEATENVIEHLRTKLLDLSVDLEHVEEIIRRARGILVGPNPDQPIDQQPALAAALALAHVHEVSVLAALDPAATAALVAVAPAPRSIDDATLRNLVANNSLTTAQAKAVGYSAAVYAFAGEDPALATAIKTATLQRLGGNAATSTADLAKLNAADWAEFLRASTASLPTGVSADAMAAVLAARFGALHPAIALTARLPQADAGSVVQDALALAPLYARNPVVVGTDFSKLDTTGLSAAQVAELKTTQARLAKLHAAYPGLALATLLDDPKLDPKQKGDASARRVTLFQGATTLLGDTPLSRLNLSVGSSDLGRLGLDKVGATQEEQGMVLTALQSYQRAMAVAKNPDAAQALVQKGYTSATSVGLQQYTAFRVQSQLPPAAATRIWSSGRAALAETSLAAMSMADTESGMFRHLAVSNQPAAVGEYLKQLPSYQELFGNLSFCQCEECQSILSPAAYFVDLMKFIDDKLRSSLPGPPGGALDLKTRRPDLWTLELTCDNTNQRIPTLDLVNEIFENYVAARLTPQPALADRSAIARNVYPTLALAASTFQQPFNLALTRIDSYLSSLGSTRGALANALGNESAALQAEFRLSQLEWSTTISVQNTDLEALASLLGVTLVEGQKIDVAELGAALKLTRAELGQLSLVVNDSVTPVEIISAKRSTDSIQNDVEWLTCPAGAALGTALDRMRRFARLLPTTGWSIAELGLVIKTVGDPALGATALADCARVHRAQAQLQISAAQACQLVGGSDWVQGDQSLLDQLFNPPPLATLPQPTTRFFVPAFRQTPVVPEPGRPSTLPRLLAGLSLDVAALASLSRQLRDFLAQENAAGFDPDDPVEDQRYFLLSAPNLALLFRHARLAQLLSVSVDELFQLLSFKDLQRVGGIADLSALLDAHTSWKASPYSLDDIAFATGRTPRNALAYPAASAVAAAVVKAAANDLNFADTLFAVALGTTEQGSRDLLTLNGPTAAPARRPIFESPQPGVWRIVAGIDVRSLLPADLVLPESATVSAPVPGGTFGKPIPVTAQAIIDALLPHTASEVLLRDLSTQLAMSAEKVRALLSVSGQALTAEGIARALQNDAAAKIEPLVDLVAAIQPLTVALAASLWDAEAITFMHEQPQLIAGPAVPFPATLNTAQPGRGVTFEQLQNLSVYARLARRAEQPPEALAAQAIKLKEALLALGNSPSTLPLGWDARLAAVLGVSTGLVVGLRGAVTLPKVAAAALDRLDQATQFAQTLAVDSATLGAALSADFDVLSSAADGLLAVLGARYADDATRAAQLDLAEQPIRGAKRDALADYLIHSRPGPVTNWKTPEDLYQYFLIDVEAGGCSTTSRVVAATMSAQLYIYRAIMNLETEGGVTLSMPADGVKEWEWRKNYRVWQANRKVFLWPENYLEPDLRDDKTPLFKELEQELLQTDIDDQSVLDAYTKYLAGFQEIASLTVAGAYHDRRAEPDAEIQDVLHLFGVTSGDPPVYYYRTCQNLIANSRDASVAAVWSPWQKINVQITGRKVSPIVHEDRLQLFWVNIKTRPMNQTIGGTTEFAGYLHTLSVKFSTLRGDGSWTAPQEIALPSDPLNRPNDALLPNNPRPASFFGPSAGQVEDPLSQLVRSGTLAGAPAKLDPSQVVQRDPLDSYTLSGPNWEWLWLVSDGVRLQCHCRNFLAHLELDLFKRAASSVPGADAIGMSPPPQLLYAKTGSAPVGFRELGVASIAFSEGLPPAPLANAVLDEARRASLKLEGLDMHVAMNGPAFANIPAISELLAVPGSEGDVILQIGNDMLWLQGSATDDGNYVLHRLGTLLVEGLSRELFRGGVDGFLNLFTQYNELIEQPSGVRQPNSTVPPVPPAASLVDAALTKRTYADDGPNGTYFKELFFHIPFLIANALSSRGRFEAAQKWYHYIFDPTAPADVDVEGFPAEEAARRLLDRVWRFRGFRDLSVETLQATLTDAATIAAYLRNPFNPWAIARGRTSAFQKAIVMKYVDNLTAWADSLFTQFTMESVNEAMMLYIMASDLLGPRLAQIGDCGTPKTPYTYATVGALFDGAESILGEIETWTLGTRATRNVVGPAQEQYASYGVAPITARFPLPSGEAAAGAPPPAVADALGSATDTKLHALTQSAAPAPSTEMFRGLGWNQTSIASWGPALGNATTKTADKLGGRSFVQAWHAGSAQAIGGFGLSVLRQAIPFCVPANPDLLAYWDRLEDRLFKTRHCMDIDGQRRDLALFAPPIDPMQLVAMKAAGLSLSDVLGSTSSDLPPYRFLYLIDRAKAFASSVSGFGSALTSTLEKKDAELLNRLRLTQQMNLTQLTTQIRQSELDVAIESLEALNRQQDSAQYRSEYYQDFINSNRNVLEVEESVARHGISATKITEGTFHVMAAMFSLFPQVGSPYAMTYGGFQLSKSLWGFANSMAAISLTAEAIANSTSLENSFLRRSEGWAFQKKQADFDSQSLARQIKAATIRVAIAQHSLDLHLKSIDQMQEFLELTDGKFTSLGLYTWLSGELQSLYVAGFQNALAIAKLAERAYRFERGGDASSSLIEPSRYWDAPHAGLLAGEKLLMDLQGLERRFLETNYRTLEVDQAFALSQIDAKALLDLRETGLCKFTVDEVFFDLFYPGQYKRRIKAVRLTIPCITGPYVNVSASLDLLASQLRPTPNVNAIVDVPPSRSVSIATSTAQNDAGVFELSFRDERYMPFEGLGAVNSQWQLTLPKSFRQFDYQTINDVILSISYTAEFDGALRDFVENATSEAEVAIARHFSENPAKRLFSLRQDFSSAFTRLLRSPTGTQVNIELTDRHFPMFVRSRLAQGGNLTIMTAQFLLRASPPSPNTAQPPEPPWTGFSLTFGRTPEAGAPPAPLQGVDLAFTSDSELNGAVASTNGTDPAVLGQFSNLVDALRSNGNAKYSLVIKTVGAGLAPASPAPGDASAADAAKLLDVLVYLEYELR